MEYIFLNFFVQATLTLIVKLNKTISKKYNLKQYFTLFSSIAHEFIIILTADMVNDLRHKNRKHPKLALPTSKSHDNFSDTSNRFSDNQTSPTNNTNGITSPPPFNTKRPKKFRLTRLNLFPKRSPLSQSTISYRTSVLPPAQEQNPPLPIYSITMTIQHDNSATLHDNLVNDFCQKYYGNSHQSLFQNKLFLHHLNRFIFILLLSKLILNTCL